MKKILFNSIPGICLLISTTTTLNGQIASNHFFKPAGRFTALNRPEPGNSPVVVGRVNPTVIRSFLKTYKDVSGEKWIEVRQGFVAMFNYNSIDYQVAYDKKGNLLHTIRSYNEDKMSQDLRHIVKSNYYDYDINRVHEIETPLNSITYFIQLVGKKELINLGVSDGEMEELGKFNRSK
ncbi:MAG TPA: hypothetical protein VGQ53_17955 [Chitinophagaceae bacterium]|nr:hypothetical protein [Chitinophagaceae bacterium]